MSRCVTGRCMSWQKLYPLPDKFRGDEGRPEEEQGKEGGEGRVGSCQEGSNDRGENGCGEGSVDQIS